MSGERVLVEGRVGSASLPPGKLFVGDGWGVNAYLTFREGGAAELETNFEPEPLILSQVVYFETQPLIQ